MNAEKYPIDKEVKIMFIKALSRGYFEEADFEFLAQKYENVRFDNDELHGSIPIKDWIRWRNKENTKKETA